MSRKLRAEKNVLKSRLKKRKNVFNLKAAEREESSFSASAKKLKSADEIIFPRSISQPVSSTKV